MKRVIMRNLCGTIFCIKTNVLQDFRFCMSVPLKSGSDLSKRIFICFSESPLKMMKNVVYFILKAFFVLKIFIFLCWLFGYWGKDTSSTPSSFCFSRGKSKWSAAQFQYILIVLHLAYNKNKLHKSLDYWSRYILNFDFVEKGQGIVSTPHFMYDFSRKMYLLLCWLY